MRRIIVHHQDGHITKVNAERFHVTPSGALVCHTKGDGVAAFAEKTWIATYFIDGKEDPVNVEQPVTP